MLEIELGTSKNLSHLLEKLIEYHGERSIGKSGPISTCLNVINAIHTTIYLKWVIVTSISSRLK